eukprot:TRINITY_DN1785_c0_g1_i2.p1 TRINITY_DN1785_c0_g1~~TRINITY_DN1785_c0_g1_i2.p1  ORF type:complete len:816 (+),score=182.94 TRINITY_DN1785_c0_g1_i2:502-2949(+)
MHDEATTTYSANIDQMTQGHQFLLQTFNVTPTIGWQIDPFGASSVVAEHNAMSGFKYHVIDRINWRLREQLVQSKSMEFIWTPSETLGKSTSIFTHILFENYCSPMLSGFDWEGNTYNNPPITPSNVQERAEHFASLILQFAAAYPTNNVLVPMGCDFRYVDAHAQFDNLDLLISYMQKNPSKFNMNVKYSLLSDYFDAVSAVPNVQWPVYSGDFFSYDDNDNSWWSGYFTSRTELKGFVRKGEAYMRSFDIALASASLGAAVSSSDFASMTVLRSAMAQAQHHDAVSGTEKDFVATEYQNHIQLGMDKCEPILERSIAQLVRSDPSAPALSFTNDSSMIYTVVGHAGLPVVVYNSLGVPRTEMVRVGVNTTGVFLLDASGQSVPHQVMPNSDPSDTKNPFVLYFQANVPALGFTVYFIEMYCANSVTADASCDSVRAATVLPVKDFVPAISNGLIQVNMSASTGRMSSITNIQQSLTVQADQNILAYESYAGPGQASGAYIFRPVGPASPITSQQPQTTVVQGRWVQEIRQQFTPWAFQTIRLTNGAPWVEVESRLGPIPGNNEVITRFSTNIANQQVIFTDDNGWEFQKRSYQGKEALPIPASHFPTLYSSYMTAASAPHFSVSSDRSRSASSQGNGQLELMMHRRMLQDDGRGVDEALDDQDIVNPTVRVTLSPPTSAANDRYLASYTMNYPLQVFYATSTVPKPAEFSKSYHASFSLLKTALPPAVHIVSLKYLASGSNQLVLRIAHMAAAGEPWAVPQQIDLNMLFNFKVVRMVETTLTANQPAPNGAQSPQFTISPKQIRTFIITVASL